LENNFCRNFVEISRNSVISEGVEIFGFSKFKTHGSATSCWGSNAGSARPRLSATAGMSSVGATPTAPDLPALSVRAVRGPSGARALDSLRAVKRVMYEKK